MRLRLVIALVAAILVALGSSPAQARAADTVVTRDTLIQYIWALDGDLVYWRYGKTAPKRVWMVRFNGRLHRAHGIPRSAGSGGLGLDAKSRKVLTFAVERFKGGYLISAKWFVYDLARDRTRPLHGLPAKCVVSWVSVWRGSTAYTANCKKPAQSGLFLRQGKQTTFLSSDPGGGPLVFRRGTLAVIFDTGLDDYVVKQWTANGKRCVKWIDSSYGDATWEGGWYPSGLWATGDGLAWTMGHWSARPNFGILIARVPPGCATPNPIRELPFTPETATLQTLTIDGRRVFYADGNTLRLHVVPAEPSIDPPPNDDFEHAQQLPAEAPFTTTGRVAYATVQPGEPLADAKHTVWYAYRPTTSGTVYVSVDGGAIWDFNEQHYVGTIRYGVYTGTSPESLTPIPPSGYSTRVDAVAGETYWIAVGSPVPEPNYQPIGIHVGLTPSS